jgi:hypothetical protein
MSSRHAPSCRDGRATVIRHQRPPDQDRLSRLGPRVALTKWLESALNSQQAMNAHFQHPPLASQPLRNQHLLPAAHGVLVFSHAHLRLELLPRRSLLPTQKTTAAGSRLRSCLRGPQRPLRTLCWCKLVPARASGIQSAVMVRGRGIAKGERGRANPP